MIVRIGRHSVRIYELPNGSIVIAIDGKTLPNRTFIFRADALKAAREALEEAASK